MIEVLPCPIVPPYLAIKSNRSSDTIEPGCLKEEYLAFLRRHRGDLDEKYV
jgi:hypothetical protein